jgi:hypothetical protein
MTGSRACSGHRLAVARSPRCQTATRTPVGAAAGLVAGGAAGWVERGEGGPQADHGARVDARAGRAGQDRGDGRGQLTGLVQYLRARVELFFVAAHDLNLPLRAVLVKGTRTRPGVITSLRLPAGACGADRPA